jgi:hypothetical protein
MGNCTLDRFVEAGGVHSHSRCARTAWVFTHRKEPEPDGYSASLLRMSAMGNIRSRPYHRHLCTLGMYEPSFRTQHQSRNRTIVPAFLDIVYLIT